MIFWRLQDHCSVHTQEKRLKKYTNYALDLLLLLSGVASLASGYVVWFVLPRGMGLHGGRASFCGGGGTGVAGNTEDFFEMFRYTWIEIHNWASVVLAVIVIIHILFHWSWIVGITKKISSYFKNHARRALELYGAALMLFILFVFDCLSGLVLWLVLPRGAGDYYPMLSGSGRTFLGLQRIVWVDLHAWIAVTIVSIIIVHLVLNWSWVAGVSKKIFRGAVKAAS